MENTREYSDDTVEIDLQEIFMLLIRKLWLLIICGIIGGAAGFLISTFLITPMYESTTSIYILNKSDSTNITYSDVQLGTQLTKDYAQLIKSRYVIESVISQYNLGLKYSGLCERIDVTTPSDTRLIEITVTDPDPEMAKALADSIRTIASKHIEQVMDIEAVNVVDEANLPENPSSPNVSKNTLIGIVIGVFIIAALIIIRYLLDDKIKTAEDVEKFLGLSTLASIPVIEGDDAYDDSKKKRKKDKTHIIIDTSDSIDVNVEDISGGEN